MFGARFELIKNGVNLFQDGRKMDISEDRFEQIVAREEGLRRSLNSKQMSMIAIGGAIAVGASRLQGADAVPDASGRPHPLLRPPATC